MIFIKLPFEKSAKYGKIINIIKLTFKNKLLKLIQKLEESNDNGIQTVGN